MFFWNTANNKYKLDGLDDNKSSKNSHARVFDSAEARKYTPVAIKSKRNSSIFEVIKF